MLLFNNIRNNNNNRRFLFRRRNSTLTKAADNNDINKFKEILDKSIKKNKVIDVNKPDKDGFYPLLWCIYWHNDEMTKSLIDYTYRNGITPKTNNNDIYYSFYKGDEVITKLLLEYAEFNNIYFNLNTKDGSELYPILICLNENKSDMLEVLLDYANRNNINLVLNEEDLKNRINVNIMSDLKGIKRISDINIEILKLLKKSKDENNIIIKFSENSELEKVFSNLN